MSLVSQFTQPDSQSSYFVQFLEQLDQHRQLREMRVGATGRMGVSPGAKILDLGCGIGGATAVFKATTGATGLVAGVDISIALIDVAKQKVGTDGGVEFRVADASAIPYADGFFDAAYSERVFLYLPDRLAALAELRRVVKARGRICLVDTDFDSTAIYSSKRALTRRMTDAAVAAIPNPNSGRELPSLVKAAGFTDIEVETFAVRTPHEFLVHEMGGVLSQAVEHGLFTPAELSEWSQEQARLYNTGDFFHAWLFVRVTARK